MDGWRSSYSSFPYLNVCYVIDRSIPSHDLTHFFSYSLQYYLPPEPLVNKDFLKDVFVGKKQLMLKTEVKQIEVPHYEEISVKALYPELNKDAQMMSYLPDKYPTGKAPPREYFFNILSNTQLSVSAATAQQLQWQPTTMTTTIDNNNYAHHENNSRNE